jgi:hypothetical protein
MDNLDVETIEQIQDHEPSVIDSDDEIVSIPDTEPDGTADSVPEGVSNTNIMSTVEPTNGDTSNNNDLNTKVVTSPTRLFKDTPNPERTSDGFLKPITPKRKGAKSSKDPIQPAIPTTVIDTSEAAKLKADLEAKDKILRDYEEQINQYRFLINDPRYQEKLRKEQAKRDMVIDTAVPNVESPWCGVAPLLVTK